MVLSAVQQRMGDGREEKEVPNGGSAPGQVIS